MSRKDSNNRVLRPGESQRKDGLYQYRYTDLSGKRHTIYSKDLKELREKEKALEAQMLKAPRYANNNMTVEELVRKHLLIKQGIKRGTKVNLTSYVNARRGDPFMSLIAKDVKTSDAKMWAIKLHNDGLKRKTIVVIFRFFRGAFNLLVEDDVISKNPFAFSVSQMFTDDSDKRNAISEEDQERFLEFIKSDGNYFKHYNLFVILLETGLRVSEAMGLTEDDIDFEKGTITVNKQLLAIGSSPYIETPKSASGFRVIPMSFTARRCLMAELGKMRGTGKCPVIDGVSGFIFLTRNGNPMTSYNVEQYCKHIVDKYNRIHPDDPLPKITPHILRHTFCTRMSQRGMDIKALQYIMGHSTPMITMTLYNHANNEQYAMNQFSKVMGF